MHRVLIICLILSSISVFPKYLHATVFPNALLPQKPHAESAEKSGSESDVVRIRALLQDARAEFNKIDAPGGLSIGAPPGTPQYDLVRRRFLLRLIVTNYERLQAELNRAENLHNKQLVRPDTNTLVGISPGDKPPYSILVVERVREKVQGAQFNVKLGEMALESSTVKKGNAEDNLKKLEEKQRALLESIEKEPDPAKAAALTWKKLLADLNHKMYATEMAVLLAGIKNNEIELAIARSVLASLGDKLDEVLNGVRFTEADLNQIKNQLEERKNLLERQLEQALAEYESRQLTVNRRLSALVQRPDSRHHASTTQQQAADAAGLVMQEQFMNAGLKVELLRDMMEFNRFELMVWELRYASEVTKDTESTSRLTLFIPQVMALLDNELKSVTLDLKLIFQKLNEAESALLQSHNGTSRDEYRQLVTIYQAREELLLSRIKATTGLHSVFERLSAHYSEHTKKTIAAARWSNWKIRIASIWGYELFATEDIYTVDGKEVKGKRGVTVSKVISALALLIIGWLGSSLGTKILARYMIKRYDIPEGGALLARRWFMALIFVILLFSSLNLVRIPLTAFAFLGGAIAIGTGFGIQDLMKNLMSGLMMLAERPFRIGDYIDVDGVRGRVTSIGIRSSTIRDVTGIETLVPNTTFVEKNVTNWTYSTHQVRYSVTVGVAYGSVVATVKEQLLQAAALHEHVLDIPAPQATLDDFGADALVFGLHYWIALDSQVDPRGVASDLRIMIERQLSAEGIAIAFPQRDIHLDTLRPIRVEVVER